MVARAEEELRANGWVLFDDDPALRGWLKQAGPAAIAASCDPELRAAWLECESTWFVGVEALANDASGAVAGSGPLRGRAIDFLKMAQPASVPALHRAQVSVVWPGYPRPRSFEGTAAFAYRKIRDAAHVDGLRPVGPDRQRKIEEPHAWVLGIPVTESDAGASPLTLWEGSHHVIRAAFAEALQGYAPQDWGQVDLTAPYQAARRRVFDTCNRIKLSAKPGQAYVLHRHLLHGVAPWEEGARAPDDGRVIIYFRPECAGGVEAWLNQP